MEGGAVFQGYFVHSQDWEGSGVHTMVASTDPSRLTSTAGSREGILLPGDSKAPRDTCLGQSLDTLAGHGSVTHLNSVLEYGTAQAARLGETIGEI